MSECQELMRMLRTLDDERFLATITHMEHEENPMLNLVEFDNFVNRQLAARTLAALTVLLPR